MLATVGAAYVAGDNFHAKPRDYQEFVSPWRSPVLILD